MMQLLMNQPGANAEAIPGIDPKLDVIKRANSSIYWNFPTKYC